MIILKTVFFLKGGFFIQLKFWHFYRVVGYNNLIDWRSFGSIGIDVTSCWNSDDWKSLVQIVEKIVFRIMIFRIGVAKHLERSLFVQLQKLCSQRFLLQVSKGFPAVGGKAGCLV